MASTGFSYAQAARSRPVNPAPAAPAQVAPQNKVTPMTTPPTVASFTDLAPGGNWADDVEASVGQRVEEPRKAEQAEASEGSPVRDMAVERAKSVDKSRNAASGVSSPDLPASSSSTSKDDDASSAPTNGSSETTWETKSQTSEPAWIAERTARQSSSQVSESTVKPDKKSKEAPLPQPPAPPKPVVLTEAVAPSVNPWQQRAELMKAKAASQPPPTPVSATKSASTSQTPHSSSPAENERPRADPRKKAGSIAGGSRNGEQLSGAAVDVRKPGSFQGKRNNDARGQNFQGSKTVTDVGVSNETMRPQPQGRSSVSSRPTAPPPVKDEGSWPTPDLAVDTQRKESPEKEDQDKQNAEATLSGKPRKKKSEWESMVVTPNIIWETQGINTRGSQGSRGSERGGRGGPRSRGGFRGAANGSGGDRQSGRGSSEDDALTTPIQNGPSNSVDPSTVSATTKAVRATSEVTHRSQVTEQKAELLEQPKVNGTGSFGEVPQARSPQESGAESKDEERIPEPIPRRMSVGTQTTHDSQVNGHTSGDAPIRMVPSESRKEGRSFESREPGWGSGPRGGGGKRGGRGRGSGREFANGHQSHHAYSNGDFAGSSPYAGVPPSPSFQAPRGGHQYLYQQTPGRGGWNGASRRTQSIPLDNVYGRFGGPYAQPQLPPMQTYVPGMYEQYSGYPMSAVSYQPYTEQAFVLEVVSSQLEYYFSLDNLLRDIFLRKQMDSQGFVFLDVVANFNRVKQLHADRSLLKAACFQSENIEIRVGDDGKERLRKREGWEQFVLPMDQREENARNDGPKSLHRPELPQLQSYGGMPYRGPASAGYPGPHARHDRHSYDASRHSMNGNAPQFMGVPAMPEATFAEMGNGDDFRGRAAKSPLRANGDAPPQQQLMEGEMETVAEPDAFPDDQAAALTVLVKVNRHNVPFHTAASRTFSNGSIDSRTIFGEMEKTTESSQAPATNGEPIANGVSNSSASRHASPANGRSQERPTGTDFSIYWVKEPKSDQSENAPSGLTPEPYVQLRYKALEQRSHAATGTCPYDLDVLYNFWSHFLIRNFNSRMYAEFKYYAHEDAKTRVNFNGLQNLVKFYAQALLSHNPIRDRLVKDYVELVRNEPAKLEGAAFKQLRSTWRNGALNLKNRKKLSDLVEGPLKEGLES